MSNLPWIWIFLNKFGKPVFFLSNEANTHTFFFICYPIKSGRYGNLFNHVFCVVSQRKQNIRKGFLANLRKEKSLVFDPIYSLKKFYSSLSNCVRISFCPCIMPSSYIVTSNYVIAIFTLSGSARLILTTLILSKRFFT